MLSELPWWNCRSAGTSWAGTSAQKTYQVFNAITLIMMMRKSNVCHLFHLLSNLESPASTTPSQQDGGVSGRSQGQSIPSPVINPHWKLHILEHFSSDQRHWLQSQWITFLCSFCLRCWVEIKRQAWQVMVKPGCSKVGKRFSAAERVK